MIKRMVRDLGKYLGYTTVSAASSLKSEVANSYLNWLWWILDPLCFMLIYTFVFGYVFNAREAYFPVFIFIGISMWDFVNKTLVASVKSVKLNKALVSRVYFPKYILLLTKIWVNGIKMLISFGIVFVLMVFFRIPLSWNVLFFVPILVTMGLLTFGFACFLMHYGVYVEDLSNVLNVVLRFVFYATGIFYDVSSRIPRFGPLLSKLNPAAFLISAMRQSLIYSQTPDVWLLLGWMVVGVVLSLLGVRKIYKEENSYVKAI